MARRSSEWKDDGQLQEDITQYVREGLQRKQVLDYMERDYSKYKWSMRTLENRMRYFGVKYVSYDTPVDKLKEAVTDELNGPGRLLGYRAMNKKLRLKYDIKVPRDRVYDMMFEIDPQGLEERRPMAKKAKKGDFVSRGPDWVHSLDGHDKMMGYQNWTFPLAVYGSIDTCSRKLLWIKVWDTNSEPNIVGKWYLENIREAQIVPNFIRIDRGTETGVMGTIHAYLRRNHGDLEDPTKSVMYGPSTANQVYDLFSILIMRRSNCSVPIPPIPPSTPGDITFWGVAPVSLSLYFFLAPPYLITNFTLFASSRPFLSHAFFL